MFTLYTVLLTLHILFVVSWVGAGIAVQMLSIQARASTEWPAQLEAFSARYFPAVSGLAGLTGILLWIDGPWAFGEVWVLLAVAGWIASSVIGATQLSPATVRWRDGDQAGRDRLLALGRVDTAILVLIVADMVMKPGL